MNWALVWEAGWALGQYIRNKVSGNVTLQDVIQMVVAIDNWVGRALEAQFEYGGQELGAVQYSAQYAKQIGHDLEEIEGYQQDRWNRLFDVILPHSFKHLVGYVYSDGIWPLRDAVKSLSDEISYLSQQVGDLTTWRVNVVDPELLHLTTIIEGWAKQYGPTWDTTKNWLEHPGDFGVWAAPPLIGPLIAYLAAPEHKESRDNLAAILTGAWGEEANKVWREVEAWLVSST